MLCHTELFYIISAILIGTIALNVAISLVRKRIATKSRVLSHVHWEQQLDEDDAQEIAAQTSQHRRSKALSATRGLLRVLPIRSRSVEEKKTDEEEMLEEVEHAFSQLRQRYDEATYLGKHTARGQENHTCLYARHRVNGLTQCDGEIASLLRNQYTVLLKVNVHSNDATLIQERGWGVPSPLSVLDKLTTICHATKPTTVTMPMPRTSEELRTVIVPILEAAICYVAGVDLSA